MADQYDGYEARPGSFVNGRSTLNENIADLGGLKLAYAAFEATPPSAGSSSYSAEQQFFLSYAQLWCSTMSDDASARQLATDVHAPAQFRVNGVVRNVPEFARAFSCPAEAPLGSADRCDIW